MTLPLPTTITLPSGRATYLEDGQSNSQTVVLLHGGGLDCASLSWRYLFPDLADKYRAIAPNWPGYEGTAPFRRPYQIADIGAWLMAFLDGLQVEHAALIGVSMGGGAALWSAIHHPTRVEAIVAVGTYGVAARGPYHALSFLLTKLPLNAVSYAVMRRSRWSLRRALEAIFADPQYVTDDILAEVGEVVSRAGRGTAFSNFQRGEMTAAGLRTVLLSELPEIRQPTLFIHGKADSLVPAACVEHAASMMKNARVEIMDTGHWPMRERPGEFNARVVDFLKAAFSDQTLS